MTGTPADAALAAFLDGLAADPPPPPAVLGPAGLRAGAAARAEARPPGPELADVRDLTVPPGGRPARWYQPAGAADGVVLFLHGGGFVFGDLATHDRACRRLAARAGIAVLALDYRLAPEHPWPAAVDDAVDALRWLATGPDEIGGRPGAVAVVGDSAGGTIGALACGRLRDEEPTALPAALVLVYANTDLAGSGASMAECGHGFGLEAGDIAWFNAQWLGGDVPADDRRVSPLHEPELRGLPATVVVTAELDPLRDQGEAYAARLQTAGVPTTVRREPGMVHNFLLWDLVSPACAAAGDRVADDIATVLGIRSDLADS
jgi:acetyl esterase